MPGFAPLSVRFSLGAILAVGFFAGPYGRHPFREISQRVHDAEHLVACTWIADREQPLEILRKVQDTLW